MKTIFNRHVLIHPIMLAAYAVLVVVALGSYVFYQHSMKPQAPVFTQAQTASSTDVVTGSGSINPEENPDLAFVSGGKIAAMNVQVGQHVKSGTVLAQLDMSSLQATKAQALASLQAAQANLSLQNANTQNTSVSVDQVKAQQDTLVANAYRNLLSNGLAAVPEDHQKTVALPIISGQYNGPEGTYKIVIRHGMQLGFDDHDILTFDLETTPAQPIAKNQATALGTRGLYISFPGTMSDYDDTVWYVTIPNTRSDSYLSDLNAYQAAQDARTKAISDAQASLHADSGSSSVSSAQIKSAQAAVDAAQANVQAANIAIQNAMIVAPFDGTVSAVPVQVGDIVSPNTTIVSVTPDVPLHIDVYLSEFSVAKIAIGDPVDVTLDAYGDSKVLHATVASIDKSPTYQSGVPTYKTTIQFAAVDPSIATGMTANVTIHPTKNI